MRPLLAAAASFLLAGPVAAQIPADLGALYLAGKPLPPADPPGLSAKTIAALAAARDVQSGCLPQEDAAAYGARAVVVAERLELKEKAAEAAKAYANCSRRSAGKTLDPELESAVQQKLLASGTLSAEKTTQAQARMRSLAEQLKARGDDPGGIGPGRNGGVGAGGSGGETREQALERFRNAPKAQSGIRLESKEVPGLVLPQDQDESGRGGFVSRYCETCAMLGGIATDVAQLGYYKARDAVKGLIPSEKKDDAPAPWMIKGQSVDELKSKLRVGDAMIIHEPSGGPAGAGDAGHSAIVVMIAPGQYARVDASWGGVGGTSVTEDIRSAIKNDFNATTVKKDASGKMVRVVDESKKFETENEVIVLPNHTLPDGTSSGQAILNTMAAKKSRFSYTYCSTFVAEAAATGGWNLGYGVTPNQLKKAALETK